MCFTKYNSTSVSGRSYIFKGLISVGILFSGAFFCTTVSAETEAPVTTPISPEMKKRLANIERLLQSSALLDMLQQIESLQGEVAKLRGVVEENKYTIENRQRDLYTNISRRLESIEGTNITKQLPNEKIEDDDPPLETLDPMDIIMPPQNQMETEADEDIVDPDQYTNKIDEYSRLIAELDEKKKELIDSQRRIQLQALRSQRTKPKKNTEADDVQAQAKYQYDKAFKLLKQSRYDQAIKVFRIFLQTYTNSQYLDNAQYWIAEALYVKHLYEDAIREYNNLLSNYPESEKVSHSLLKIGYSYQALNKISEAKLWYNDLRQRFPNTTASRLANHRLRNINDP